MRGWSHSKIEVLWPDYRFSNHSNRRSFAGLRSWDKSQGPCVGWVLRESGAETTISTVVDEKRVVEVWGELTGVSGCEWMSNVSIWNQTLRVGERFGQILFSFLPGLFMSQAIFNFFKPVFYLPFHIEHFYPGGEGLVSHLAQVLEDLDYKVYLVDLPLTRHYELLCII